MENRPGFFIGTSRKLAGPFHIIFPIHYEHNIEQDSGHAVLLKTNMLYDAAAIPNIGLEVSVGKGWSVGANWMYAWWSNDARHRFWRAYGGDVELRRWFSPRRESRSLMCGHHIGVYGQMLTYDIEWGGRGYLGDRWSWAAGLSYGYSLPAEGTSTSTSHWE